MQSTSHFGYLYDNKTFAFNAFCIRLISNYVILFVLFTPFPDIKPLALSKLKHLQSTVSMWFNPLLHRYSFKRISNRQLLKTLWEKKKLLVTSNFFFSLECFQLIQITVSPFVHIFDIISLFAVQLEEPKIGISGKGLTLYQTSPDFYMSVLQVF